MKSIFIETEPRYKLDLFKLSSLRESLNISAERFAELVGWSTSYQYQLEEYCFGTISEKTLLDIVQVFKRFNVIFTRYYKTRRFSINTEELMKQRCAKNLSVNEFSIIAGWSTQYQYNLERGEIKVVSETTAKLITAILKVI